MAQLVRIARKARLGYDDFLYISQQARKKLGLRRGRKERRLPQLLADADLKRFFRAIQDCGDVQHEILLKLLFYTAVRVSELVHIEVGDVDLDARKIFINRGKGAKDRYILFPASFRLVLKSHDNLVDVLLTSLQSFHNNALREHKDQCYVRREQRNESLKVLVGFLDHGVLEILAQIDAVAKNSELTDSEKVQRICALLTDNQVTQSLDPEQLAELKATLVTELSEEDYYLILSSKSVRMQNRVGPILKAVTFLAEQSAKDLHRAMEHFRLKDGAIDKTAPVDFLTPDDRTAVSRDGRFSVSLYKALLFLQVQSAIKSGTLNLEHSYKYRPLDAYLIDRERWQRDKPLLIERADLEAFLAPHQVLAELDAALYRQYLTTNAHILRRAGVAHVH